MAEPFDYTLKTESPAQAFLKAVQIGQQQQQVQAQRDKVKLEADEAARKLKFQGDVASWVANPTPEGFRKLNQAYPLEFTKLAEAQKAVGDIDRPAIRNVSVDALMAHRNKKPEQVLSILDQRIEAAKDNPQLQKKFMDMKTGYQSYADKPNLQESLIVTVLAQDDEGAKIYDKAFKQTELTSFQKSLEAAGIPIDSPRGITLAEAFVENQADPLVEMETPGGGKFVGPRSEYFKRYGGNAPSPTVKALPAIGEVRNGFKFNGGDPANKDNWSKVGSSGGQTATPSGNFQGQ